MLGLTFLVLLAALILVGEGREVTAAVLYVDDDAGEGGDGSTKTPFSRIQEAVDTAKEGDTIRVWGGKYYESVKLNKTVSLRGNGSANTSISTSDPSKSDYGSATVVVISADWVNLSGFEIYNNGSTMDSGEGVTIIRANNVTVEKNNIHSNIIQGIDIYSSSNIIIQENTILHNFIGIWLNEGNSDILVTGNTISNEHVGIDLGFPAGITTIFNNSISRCQFGLSLRSYNGSVIIMEENSITSNHNAGIVFNSSAGKITLKYSEIYNNGAFGVKAEDGSSGLLDARYNWWGNDSGPYHPEKNPSGTGDNVSNLVKFSPWLDENGTAHPDEGEGGLDLLSAGTLLLISIGVVLLIILLEPLGFPLLYHISPLYTRLNEDKINRDIAQQNIRGQIYRFVSHNPGENLTSIKHNTSTGYGTTVYHLGVLQREGYLRTVSRGGKKLFWAKEEFPGFSQARLTKSHEKILKALEQVDKISRKDLEKKTEIPRSSLDRDLKELVELDLVEEEFKGKEKLVSLKNG